MKRKKYNNAYLRKVLESSAPVSNFYVYGGLQHFCDVKGQIMLVMEDDDEINAACIKYLREQGIPEFESLEQAEEHARFLAMRITENLK